MSRSLTVLLCAALSGGTCALADVSYEQTAKLTGGAMAGAMKVVGVFSKQAREPIRSTIYLKGDRMATVSQNNAHVVDLQKETITEIDFQRKTYSVITFAEMTAALKSLEAKRSRGSEDAQTTVKVAALKETGQTRQISGLNAREWLMQLEMETTDKKSGGSSSMTITDNLWVAQAPGYQEVKSFGERMAQKLAWTPGGNMFTQGDPNVARGMANLYKEAAKLDGVPVLQVMKMGTKLSPEQQAQASQPPPPQAQAQAEAQEKPAGGALGRLGGRLGGFGGLGRKKPQEQPAQTAAEAPRQQAEPGALMEMTVESGNFSTAAVDGSKFEVPAGFKQVESEMQKAARR